MRTVHRLSATVVLGWVVAGSPAADAQTNGTFCGLTRHHPRRYAHVVWIWLENHGYEQIVGSPDAPYINALIAGCGLATNFHNLTHASLPNYVGAVTGQPLSALLPFDGDCEPGPSCSTPARSLFHQVSSWKAYMESMTTNCQPTGVVGYAVRHNPPAYLTSLPDCAAHDVPYEELQADLDADTLPAFAFVTPNTVNDMHDGTDPAAIQAGDRWLEAELPKLLDSAAYRSGKTVVFVTFDEGETGPDYAIGEDCARNTSGDSCHIPTIVVSPSTPAGTSSGRLYSHYSLLKTTEQLLGIRGRLDLARRARSLRRPFGL